MLRTASLSALLLAVAGSASTASSLQPAAGKPPVPKAASKSAPAPAAAAATPAKTEVFSRWIEDLPVMPGLTETDGGYSFEIAQGGRLAEARLHGVADADVVRSFYASTLPPLGWQAEPTQPFLYHRGRERLILHVQPAKPQGVLAVFVLSPRAATAMPLPPS